LRTCMKPAVAVLLFSMIPDISYPKIVLLYSNCLSRRIAYEAGLRVLSNYSWERRKCCFDYLSFLLSPPLSASGSFVSTV
jgi:hypothetical protein